MAPKAPDRLTIKQAAELYGLKKDQIGTAIASHAIFKEDGAVEKRVIEGTDIEVKYIRADALKRWYDQRGAARASGGTRVRREGSRYTLMIKPDQLEAVTKALEPMGLSLERAYKPTKKAEQANGATAPQAPAEAVNDQASMADLFKGEEVSA